MTLTDPKRTIDALDEFMTIIQSNSKSIIASSAAIVLTACLICATAGCGESVPTGNSLDVEQKIPDALEDQFAETRQSIRDLMAEQGWPGLAIAVVDRDRVLWSETFGVRDNDTRAPITSDTVFNIGSITKTVAATAVMLAVQDGLVDLDTPITTYLPDFTVNSRWEGHPEQRITLRHLLNHTAGFTHEAPVGNNFDPASPSWADHLASITDTWLKFPVGERYAYSNLGVETASYIVQEVSGLPFETFVNKRIFEPLGMRSSFVNTPTRNGSCDACATGQNNWYSQLPTYIPMEGAGGIRMTLDDATHYLQFHLNRGRVGNEQVLGSQLIDEMYRPSVQIAHNAPMLRYGLGVVLRGDFADTYSVHHLGDGFGFSASMRWYPEYGIGAVTFINSVNRGPDWEIGTTLLMAMIEGGLVRKINDPDIPSVDQFYEHVEATKRMHELSAPGESAYQQEWEEYVGRYCALQGAAYVLNPYVDTSSECLHVFKEDGYLYHDGSLHPGGKHRPQRLVEHQRGLFFTEISGEALDLRSDSPTFRNIAVRKIN